MVLVRFPKGQCGRDIEMEGGRGRQKRSQFGEEWCLGEHGCSLLIRGSPSQLSLTEWGGLVCRPISNHAYKPLPFQHMPSSIGGRNGNGYLPHDYPIER